MNYAALKNCDIANGPGVRVSLFVSGCTHRCKGCFNEIAWDFDYGQPYTEQTQEMILDMLAPDHVQGITLLGGEPFDPRNQEGLLGLVRAIREKYPTKSIWCFTGYIFERDILGQRLGPGHITMALLKHLDVLVDGPFVEEKKDLMLRFRGSSNQRLIDVQKSLAQGQTILWEDWQGNGRGMK